MELDNLIAEHVPDLKYLLTGTRVYGPATKDSDLDIVMTYAGAYELIKFLEEHGIEIYKTEGQDEYGDDGGFYFDLGFIKVNIIICGHDRPFEEWEKATERMKKIAPIHDREQRLLVFAGKEPTPEEYTCYKCGERDKCAFVDDLYNTGGECLAMK